MADAEEKEGLETCGAKSECTERTRAIQALTGAVYDRFDYQLGLRKQPVSQTWKAFFCRNALYAVSLNVVINSFLNGTFLRLSLGMLELLLSQRIHQNCLKR